MVGQASRQAVHVPQKSATTSVQTSRSMSTTNSAKKNLAAAPFHILMPATALLPEEESATAPTSTEFACAEENGLSREASNGVLKENPKENVSNGNKLGVMKDTVAQHQSLMAKAVQPEKTPFGMQEEGKWSNQQSERSGIEKPPTSSSDPIELD